MFKLTLIQPAFVTHLPKELVPLAKLSPAIAPLRKISGFDFAVRVVILSP